ncbi:MAG: Nramp family divalent metal transporter [Phycisphaerales bacterium]|nr:MAG: Nramp family divalent metal transporter [Phycisphaerales bacterium]
MADSIKQPGDTTIRTAPTGLAILALVGPSIVWAAEYIGSGEVILATRTGAILGTTVLWAVILGIFLKFWIGMSGARYTVCTGEGMIDMFERIPGPRHWVVWIVLVVQFACGTFSIGAVATAAGVFVNSIIPIGTRLAVALVTIFALAVAWSGVFDVLKIVMSFLVLIIVLGVMYVAAHVFPGFTEFLRSLSFAIPEVPQWAASMEKVSDNPWKEILPLLGWGAGGFASQVWYTYWVLGAGYGAAAGRGYGRAADESALRHMSLDAAQKIKGWCRVLYFDSSLAMVIGITVTGAFLIAGAGVLGPQQLAPEGNEVAFTLSKVFSGRWGSVGGFLFLLAGTAALISTQTGQLAGWPRLLADSCRICIPGLANKFTWKKQFRFFLLFFFCANMVIVFFFENTPVALVKISAIFEGLLLTPLQAIWVAVGLFFVMPKLLSKEAADVLRPSWTFAAGLIVAFIVFGYFCIVQMPAALFGQ